MVEHSLLWHGYWGLWSTFMIFTGVALLFQELPLVLVLVVLFLIIGLNIWIFIDNAVASYKKVESW